MYARGIFPRVDAPLTAHVEYSHVPTPHWIRTTPLAAQHPAIQTEKIHEWASRGHRRGAAPLGHSDRYKTLKRLCELACRKHACESTPQACGFSACTEEIAVCVVCVGGRSHTIIPGLCTYPGTATPQPLQMACGLPLYLTKWRADSLYTLPNGVRTPFTDPLYARYTSIRGL
eukprot:1190851-Prorocentrum_minimum.AAC.2